MKRLILISNRAPVKIRRTQGSLQFQPAVGGLATGLRSFVKQEKERSKIDTIVWIGWPGAELTPEERPGAAQVLRSEYGVEGVFLSNEIMDRFYRGFCNKTLWPLFHYFPSYAEYDRDFWIEYERVNKTFAEKVISLLQPEDTIWIHDYHLMLLPSLIRNERPQASIGFFLHIPFPNYEVYRLLPGEWREKLLSGMLGADLVGFHTPEYQSYFLRTVEQITGLKNRSGALTYRGRTVQTGPFPMGIEFERFHNSGGSPEVQKECASLREHLGEERAIVSIDRQDYSKGILNRLEAYEFFLERYPQWREKVTVLMVVVPSRVGVENYQAVKSSIDEAVGRINGKFSRLGWTPIVYQYRELGFEELMALYISSDVALVTPLRDGMNLIAKEFVASRIDESGVLILSELAGAADELRDALIVNPNNRDQIATALADALTMPPEEQARRMRTMQARVKQYDVLQWAEEFLNTLETVKQEQAVPRPLLLDRKKREELLSAFSRAKSRSLLLDYDGTLTPIVEDPRSAIPAKNLINVLKRLASKSNTEVAIISGRDRHTLERWFGGLRIGLIAEHGAFMRKGRGGRLRKLLSVRKPRWTVTHKMSAEWKTPIKDALFAAARELPGASVEEKDYSVAFHFRSADPTASEEIVRELLDSLSALDSDQKLAIVQGKKVVEVRIEGIDKGSAAERWLSKKVKIPDFLLAIGDDVTDEDLFHAMPEKAYTIKVGEHHSWAHFSLASPAEVLDLLKELAGTPLQLRNRIA
ncbi:MAG TPA: bifunctional alpha,alpha-trehalose-phosphate synthase (UDP-forming)/trehalose-phosphatase [Candidatus Kapabacteria bacterium]|jgi:trehalose 6-phosphate synthase/phosphatase